MDAHGEPALEQLYRDHARGVHAYLVTLAGDRDEAEDLLQETFIRATRAIGGYRGGDPRVWLLRIARSTFIDARRRTRAVPVDEVPETPHRDPDVAEAHTVRVALARLPASHREALVLRDQLDLPYAQVAEVLGRSLGATKVLIHRARAGFRDAYAREGGHAR